MLQRKIKEQIKKHKKLYYFMKRIQDAIKYNILVKRGEEHKLFRGGNADLKFFVLRRLRLDGNGIASDILIFLAQLKYMEKHYKGYQPIVDMQNYPQAISETTGKAGNAWEDFFIQPNGLNYGMSDLDRARKVVLACADDGCFLYPKQCTFCDLEKERWDYYFKKYIILLPDLQKQFMTDWDKLVGNHRKTVGLKVRGTDYVLLKPGGHYIQPTAKQVIEKVKEFLAEQPDYQYIFVSTEDSKILEEIIEAFSNKVIYIENKKINYSGGAVMDAKNVGEMSRRKITEQYLEDMYFLSKCDSLICGNTSSLVPTLLWNDGKYEEVYVFDLGKYT